MKTLIEDHLRLFIKAVGFHVNTFSCLIQVIEDWSRAIDHGYEICIVFFDVQKALDSVPHVTLLKHLHSNKFILNWVKSY